MGVSKKKRGSWGENIMKKNWLSSTLLVVYPRFWVIDLSPAVSIFVQPVRSRHPAPRQPGPSPSIWRTTTAGRWSSSSPPRPRGRSKRRPSPPARATAPSPTWTCSTWRTAPNRRRRSTESWTPSSRPTGKWTTRRVPAVTSSRSRWGTLQAWTKSKNLFLWITIL